MYDDLLDEGLDKGPALGQFTLLQILAQVLGVGGDGLHIVQHHPSLGQHRSGLLRRGLKPLLTLPVVLDAGLEVVNVQVGGFGQVVEAVQPPPHFGKLRLGGLQSLALLPGHAVHLLVHQLYQFPDVGLGEDVGANLADHQFLEAAGVEPGGIAGSAAPLHQGLADVVGEFAALGVLAGEGAVAPAALDQPAEQVGASHPARMGLPGCPGTHLPVDPAELSLGDYGGEGFLHPHRLSLVLGACAPDQGSGVSLVPENDVDAVLGPEPAGGVGDTLFVEGAGNVQDALTGLGHRVDALYDGGSCRVGFQGGALPGAVLHHQLPVAVGHRLATQKPREAASRIPRTTSWARFSL